MGFFSLDRASQTETTEIVDLKEMTEVLQILLQVNHFQNYNFHIYQYVLNPHPSFDLLLGNTEGSIVVIISY